MEFEEKAYLLRDGIMEEMKITELLLKEIGLDNLTDKELEYLLSKNNNHYLLLEFYCDILGLSHKKEEEFLTPTNYSEYLSGILCDEGYIIFTIVQNENGDNISFSTKARERYNRSDKSILMHVPYQLESICEEDVQYLNEIRTSLEREDSVHIYSQKKKWNGKYKTGREYSLDGFYGKMNTVDKKIR